MRRPTDSLSCDRVELRRWRLGDLGDLHRAIEESRDHLVPWMPWAAGQDRQGTADYLARTREQWASGEAFDYAIISDATVIGGCGLYRRAAAVAGRLCVGYWLHQRRTGRGFATMAATALVGQGFRLTGVDHIEIHHDAANPASGAVAHRLGFTEAERIRVPGGPGAPGEVGVEVVWRMSAEQWRARTAPGGNAPDTRRGR